jgi:hypothetical protein
MLFEGAAMGENDIDEPGARLLPPGAPPITGKTVALDFWQRRIATGSDRWNPDRG